VYCKEEKKKIRGDRHLYLSAGASTVNIQLGLSCFEISRAKHTLAAEEIWDHNTIVGKFRAKQAREQTCAELQLFLSEFPRKCVAEKRRRAQEQAFLYLSTGASTAATK
jgi:hypothetical protein